MKWYLTDENGVFVFEGTIDEMFRQLSLDPSDNEEPLYGPVCQLSENAGGGWAIHPEGIRAPGATYEVFEEEEEEEEEGFCDVCGDLCTYLPGRPTLCLNCQAVQGV